MLLPHTLLEPVRGQYRNQRQGEDERADQRERHGLGHGMEQLRRRSAESIDRQIAGQNHRDRVEDRTVDVLGRRENDFVQLIGLSFPQRQFAVDVLHHNDGAVDDDAEIDGADGQQVGGAIMGM